MKHLIVAMLAICCSIIAHAQVPEDSVRVAELRVTGITCAADLPLIEKKLVNAEGVDEVVFSPIEQGASVVRITYHPAFIEEKELMSLVEQAPSCDAPGEFPYRAKPLKKR